MLWREAVGTGEDKSGVLLAGVSGNFGGWEMNLGQLYTERAAGRINPAMLMLPPPPPIVERDPDPGNTVPAQDRIRRIRAYMREHSRLTAQEIAKGTGIACDGPFTWTIHKMWVHRELIREGKRREYRYSLREMACKS
jgi:hypothetical protein